MMARRSRSCGCRLAGMGASVAVLSLAMAIPNSNVPYETCNTRTKHKVCLSCLFNQRTRVAQRMKDSLGATGASASPRRPRRHLSRTPRVRTMPLSACRYSVPHTQHDIGHAPNTACGGMTMDQSAAHRQGQVYDGTTLALARFSRRQIGQVFGGTVSIVYVTRNSNAKHKPHGPWPFQQHAVAEPARRDS